MLLLKAEEEKEPTVIVLGLIDDVLYMLTEQVKPTMVPKRQVRKNGIF